MRESIGAIAQIELLVQRERVLGIGGSSLNHHTETTVISDAGLHRKITCELCCDADPSQLFLSIKSGLFSSDSKMSSKQNVSVTYVTSVP